MPVKYHSEFVDGVEYRTYEIPEEYCRILDRLASRGGGQDYVIFPDEFLAREDRDEQMEKDALALIDLIENEIGVVAGVFFKEGGKWKLRKKLHMST